MVKSERVMDSNALEKERGITIMAKNTSIDWKGHRINIVDTPGHGDFGGEVERVLSMVDGVCLLVDANEGPMTQTKFVLSKALKEGLRPIVVLNKMDRPTSRASEVETQLFDLFTALQANDDQLAYPTLYASAREGWAVRDIANPKEGMAPLLDAIVDYIPPPKGDPNDKFCFLVTSLEPDAHLGRIVTGKVYSGKVKVGQQLAVMTREGKVLEKATVFRLVARRGVERIHIEEGIAGDIIGIAGFPKASATMTLADPSITTPLPAKPVDPPVLSMMFSVNKSPIAGKEGTQVVGQKIKNRLMTEAENNVSLSVSFTSSDDSYEVKGRGELQLGILLENMRREGFELAVSQPRILMKKEEDILLEPIEEVTIEIDNEYAGWLMETMNRRKGDIIDSVQIEDRMRYRFYAPARGLLGFRSEFMNETRGQGMISHAFARYEKYRGALDVTSRGALISSAEGVATSFAISNLDARGIMYITPGTKVYTGMIIGESSKDDDLDVNPTKQKQLSNVRTVMKEDAVKCATPKTLTLELALSIVKEDELVEITPQNIRLRKKELNASLRRKNEKQRADLG
jgi:GTP-binding protein